MKLFLTKLGSCWQSPDPHHSVSDSLFDQSENALMNPQPKRRNLSAHWRPALTAISEDNSGAPTVAISSNGDDNDDVRRKEGVRRPRKAVRTRRKPGNYSSDLHSSWKVQAQIALPAFSPVPFMF